VLIGNDADLRFADDDARDLRDVLLSGRNWDPGNIVTLIGQAAEAAAVEAALVNMGQASDGDDVCLIYFSGHGLRRPDNDGDERDGLDEFIQLWKDGNRHFARDDQFGHSVNQLGTPLYVVVIDSCFSGGHADNAQARRATEVRSTGRPILGALEGDGFCADWMAPAGEASSDLSDNRAGIVLTASNEAECASEPAALRNGTFTYFLVEGMGRRTADFDDDGWVTARDMFDYADSRTVQYAEGRGESQHPQIWSKGGQRLRLLGPPRLPDLWIRATGGAEWTGRGVYNATGADQDAPPDGRQEAFIDGAPAVFRLTVMNGTPDSADVVLFGAPGTALLKPTYYNALSGGTDITTQITSASGWPTGGLAPGEKRVFRVEVRAKSPIAHGANSNVQVWAQLAGQPQFSDKVIARSVAVAATPRAAGVTSLVALPTPDGAEVSFWLPQAAEVEASVRNVAGRPVRQLCRAQACSAGRSTLLWDGRGSVGLPVPAGVYLVEVVARQPDGSRGRALTTVRLAR
jgi:hypothetical protein